jgi:hypothetical protein
MTLRKQKKKQNCDPIFTYILSLRVYCYLDSFPQTSNGYKNAAAVFTKIRKFTLVLDN